MGRKRRLLSQRADPGPERGFQADRMGVDQGLQRIGMTDSASKLRDLVRARPQDAVALGAGNAGWKSRRVARPDDRLVAMRLDLWFHGCPTLASVLRSPSMAHDQLSNFAHRGNVLGCRDLDGVLRHLGKHRLLRILHDGASATAPDFAQTGAAVVQHPGKDDADHA